VLVDVIQLLVLALVPLGLVVTLVQLGRKALTGAWGATDGRPALRGMMVAGAGAAAAFTAYTWAPTSVYQPIQPHERGTVASAVGQIEAIPKGRPALPKTPKTRPSGAPKKDGQKKPHSGPSTATTKTTTRPAATRPATTASTPTTPSQTTTTPATPPAAATTTTTPAATTAPATTTAPTTTTTP
jgi:putative peptide zinc metalloprotease protein